MIKNKITTSELKKFKVGEQKVFTMIDKAKARSGQSLAHQMRNRTKNCKEQMEFEARKGNPSPATGETVLIITRIS